MSRSGWPAFLLLPLAVCIIHGCSSPGDASSASEDETRNVDELEEVTGKCSDHGVNHCGGKSAKSCYCDADCVDFGDCCADFTSVCGPGPILQTIRLRFAKQFRTLLNDDVFLVYVSGRLSSAASPIQELQLTGPDGQTIIDGSQGIGNWSGFAVPDPQRFQIQTQDTHPYPVGSYGLSLQLASGSKFTQSVTVDRTDPRE